MSNKVIYALLTGSTAVSAVVGDRIYPVFLPEKVSYPALTYHEITATQIPPVSASSGLNLIKSRVQVTAFAKNFPTVVDLLELATREISYAHGEMAGVQVVSVQPDTRGPDQFDSSSMTAMKAVDFIVTYYS